MLWKSRAAGKHFAVPGARLGARGRKQRRQARRRSRQVALVAGDSHVYPIVSLDGRQVTRQ